MAAYFLCLTAGGGVPLFYRTKGSLKPLPFPVIGSLNGVHMFASNHGSELLSTTTDTAKVLWKVYHNSLTLLIVTEDDGADDAHLTHLLDLCFQAMVLLYGLEDLTNIKNIERFKREIKVCYKLIDSLLERTASWTFGPTVRGVDVLAAPENAILQTYLEALVEAAASPYGCLVVRGRVAAATPRWWGLTPAELSLLPLLLHSLPPASSRDLPVFLPDGSPKVPHRLLTFQLVPGVEVCTLCGPSPSLAELEREVIRFWRTSLDSLRSILRQRAYPGSISLDHNLLGFILINRETHRCLSTVEPHDDDNKRQGSPLSPAARRRTLAAFYRTVVGGVWPLPRGARDGSDGGTAGPDPPAASTVHTAEDTYLCADTHKCYALRKDPYQLFALYLPSMPTYAMRSVTSKTLQALTQDKNVQL